MIYANVARYARRVYLCELRRVPAPAFPHEFGIYRPLGGQLLVRLFVGHARLLARADPVAVYAARRMLGSWCWASRHDVTPCPDVDERATLLRHFGHWGVNG